MKTFNFPKGMYQGRMIGFSKSSYSSDHPNDLFIFNSVMVTESNGVIWNGDINATLDKNLLIETRNIVGEDLYFLFEHDGYQYRESPVLMLIAKSQFAVRENKIQLLSSWYIEKFGDYL